MSAPRANRAVLVRLQGGLGNQLFQYAAARAIALRHRCPVCLDARSTPFKLGPFPGIAARLASTTELPPERSWTLSYKLWRHCGTRPRLLLQTGLTAEPRVLTSGPDCYLSGYFQSEQNFADAASTIRRDLGIAVPTDPALPQLAQRLATETSAACHVRRTDYLTHPLAAPCPPSYYRAGVQQIADQTGAPLTVYVFSDDPVWCTANLAFDFPMTVLSGPNRSAHEDFYLMTNCRHAVIANSTFSWWAAWLNPNPNKIVVAPSVWFHEPKRPQDNMDIVPPLWTRISNV